MAALNFNATTVAPQEAFEVLPPGWYNVRITGSEMKPTKDGGGSFLSLTMTVIDGPAANRKVFDRLNLNNKNPKAVEIAFQTLSAICYATGVIQLQDSSQLHGIPMQVKVKVKLAEGPYSEGNEIAGYRKIEGAATPAFAPAGSPAQAPAWAGQPHQPQQAPVMAPAPVQQAPAAASPPWAK